MASYKNPTDIEFVYTGGNALWSEGSYGLGAWTEPRCPVASIEGSTITMAQPCWDNSTKRVSFPMTMFMGRTVNLVGPASVGARPEYVENAFEFLGTPGQWYFDRSAATLYYVPRPREDMATADVEAPVLETLVSAKGTEAMPIHNVVFTGLQFSYATWLAPSSPEGFSEIQANYMLTGQNAYGTQGLCNVSPDIQGTCPFGSWTPAPANVSVDYGRSIRFLGNAFVHLGAADVALEHGSQSDVIEGCVFTDISGNGIELGGVNIVAPTDGQTTRDLRVANNYLHDMPVEFHGGVAILMGYAQNSVITNNQIDHTPYTGISTGWGGWPDKIMKAAQSNPSHDNKITNNLITEYLLMLADGGAIYTQGLTGSSIADGQKVDGNVVYGQLGSGHGIYTDNGCTWESITNNVFLKPNYDNWGGKHKNYTTADGGTDDPTVVTGNWFQQGNTGASSTVTVSGNHLITSIDQAPAAIVGKAGLEAAYKGLVDRRFGSAAAPEPPSRVAVLGGNGFAYVTWNPPIFQGGSPVQSYSVIPSSGAATNVPAADFAKNAYVKVSGLTNGTSYTFRVTATNATGASSPSMPSDPATPSAAAVAVSDAPRSVSAVAGDKSASVHFGQPMSDGGSPIVSYTITSNPGGRSITVSGRDVLALGTTHTTFDVVDGLTNGTPYTFTVVANNAAGASAPATTAAVTPAP
jgi:Fibronectin type III domain/Right handed beta helix region